MKLLIKSVIIIFGALLASLAVPGAEAQIRPLGNPECGPLGLFCPPNVQRATTLTVGNAINTVLIALSVLFGIIATVFIVYAGIMYITSGGDEERAAHAKRQITYGVIGLLVISVANLIVAGTIFLNFAPLAAQISGILRALSVLFGVIATVFLVYAGIQYITSGGDEEKAAAAKRQIGYAVLGLFVLLVAETGFLVSGVINLNFGPLRGYIQTILQALSVLFGVIATVFLVYAGIQYITSGGDEEKAAAAKRQIGYAVLGLFVLLVAETGFLVSGVINLNFAPLAVEIDRILVALSVLFGVIATVYIVYAGIKYITSAGEEDEAATAKRQIGYGVLGLLVIGVTNLIVGGARGAITNPLAFVPLENAAGNILTALSVLFGVIALIYTIYAGIKYITSGGDEEEAATAKRQIAYGVLGLIVIGLGGLIVGSTINLFGAEGVIDLGAYIVLSTRIQAILNALLVLVAIITLIFLIYGGAKYIMSQGDENEAETAKAQITYAVLGLIVIGLAAAIVNFVARAVG